MLLENENIKKHSYIKVGGIVRTFYKTDKLVDVIKFCKEHDRFIAISNTSKILFAFDKLDIPIIKFIKKDVIFFNDSFFAYSGISLFLLNKILSQKGISGFEYLSTIPGLVGGSIVNNSSFNNQCISDLILKVLVFKDNKFIWVDKENCNFSYRNSNLNDENILIIGGLFKKILKDSKEIFENNKKAVDLRKKLKHLYINNLGSTFKNLDNIQIGKTLDQLGYKGYKFNDYISVCDTHANFLIIKDDCKYEDVLLSLTFLEKVLYNYLGKKVELEIQVIDKYGKRKKYGT